MSAALTPLCVRAKANQDPTDNVEHISCNGKLLAYIIPAIATTERTAFLTPNIANFQLGFISYPAGGEVARHTHRPLERNIVGTSEVLLIRSGRCLVDIYDDERQIVATRELRTGDVLLLMAGGHGFRMLEDTVFLEIKQGPYTGMDEKERF
jgi:quercetin dioxygenase-like cupin family protein